MEKNVGGTNRPDRMNNKAESSDLSGYPLYPDGDDIYNKFLEETDIDPEEISKKIDSTDITESEDSSILNPTGINSGSNLDVPGSELDDRQEEIGSEDEENNYYSIGGDNHNNLDENLGE